MDILNSAKIIFEQCFALKPEETVLIVTDEYKKDIASIFHQKALELGNDAMLIEMKSRDVSGREPPSSVAAAMKEAAVVIAITEKSISHTKARHEACNNGARIATMPGITEAIIARAIDIDYTRLQKTAEQIGRILDNGSKIKLTTNQGTDITIDIEGRKAIRDNGDLREQCQSGNLPCGEVFIAPTRGTSSGVFIADASAGQIGKINQPVKVTVVDGFANNLEGLRPGETQDADKLKKLLDSVNSQFAFNIAEFGIGLNESAIISGNALEDEKVQGTCHIAFGNNATFGGDVDVPIHIDCIIMAPTIWVDNILLMEDGDFNF